MPLQNRVTPFGDIIAVRARGTVMGNRGGRIHDPATQTLLKRRFAPRRWITCVLHFKNRHRAVMGEGYTELFFLDDATALASGHRPCFECRRVEAKAFADAWMRAHGLGRPPTADEMDERLHPERLSIFAGDRAVVQLHELPEGAMVAKANVAYVIVAGGLKRWSPSGYVEMQSSAGDYELLTPPSIVAALLHGYRAR